MNYFQKNKKNIIIAVISVLLVASLVALWLQRKSVSSEDIVAVVFPSNMTMGDSLRFEDKTLNAKTKRWDFGDGKTSEKDKGIHMFSKPGFYEVKLTIDNKYTKTFPILVSAANVALAAEPEETRIDAQTQALQFENVIFRAVSSKGKTFTWRFGESGNIDSKDKMAIYSYKKPGIYTITLLTDDSPQPVTHQIKILPAYNPNEQVEQDLSAAVDNSYSEIDDDIKRTLQQIANGNNFNSNYNYLLRTYLCNNDNAAIVVNNGKPNNYYYYTTGLQFDKDNTIQDVKSTYDSSQKCIVKLEVTQSK
ncbi:PKD domain-containing protein [Elizabethkingia meningoseptica]|uniref:PKD domain-containing protein n=2 Tax=Elizabethkingia meningoseptica TaxID=238 RepID=UPI00036EE4D4|nr:PKD domain-containing protein [Elizabethkingia meningoseptica]AQX06278.1 PKD domain-containing protein [Elizabethkingia meningoseptica]AQX48327.1 PKD domain-containing protein [Elizabethkingia meningoseptica]KUY16412.1 PKD domain-containing protein [Elizabethkingia meningoseptica]MCL1674664.1 PKD domain-containing protein [Elizabethkingia meningoseptica]MCL1685968.1 PKD domain-containing protein [Elizabethkingia meningoseptica]